MAWWPTAGEATLTRAPVRVGTRTGTSVSKSASGAGAPAVTHGVRAKGQIRRIAVHNRHRYLWTLTYLRAAGSWSEVVGDLRLFFERVRTHFGRISLLAVIERGRRGTQRYHCHFTASRFLPIAAIRRAWHRGNVDIGDGERMKGVSSVRRLARYLAKYVAKQAQEETGGAADRPKGAHRYLVTQGHSPPRLTGRWETQAAGLEWLTRSYGTPCIVLDWGETGTGKVYGTWYGFDDDCLWHPPRGRGKVRPGEWRSPGHA